MVHEDLFFGLISLNLKRFVEGLSTGALLGGRGGGGGRSPWIRPDYPRLKTRTVPVSNSLPGSGIGQAEGSF